MIGDGVVTDWCQIKQVSRILKQSRNLRPDERFRIDFQGRLCFALSCLIGCFVLCFDLFLLMIWLIFLTCLTGFYLCFDLVVTSKI